MSANEKAATKTPPTMTPGASQTGTLTRVLPTQSQPKHSCIPQRLTLTPLAGGGTAPLRAERHTARTRRLLWICCVNPH